MTKDKPKYRHEGQDARAKATMHAEAERRGWLLWPSRKNRTCRAHGHTAEDLEEPCPQCFEDALLWQLLQRPNQTGNDAKPADYETSARFAERLEEHKKRSIETRRTRESIAKQAASVRSGKAAAKRRECKPKSAKRTERLWV